MYKRRTKRRRREGGVGLELRNIIRENKGRGATGGIGRRRKRRRRGGVGLELCNTREKEGGATGGIGRRRRNREESGGGGGGETEDD